jgi:hypothetical protein
VDYTGLHGEGVNNVSLSVVTWMCRQGQACHGCAEQEINILPLFLQNVAYRQNDRAVTSLGEDLSTDVQLFSCDSPLNICNWNLEKLLELLSFKYCL